MQLKWRREYDYKKRIEIRIYLSLQNTRKHLLWGAFLLSKLPTCSQIEFFQNHLSSLIFDGRSLY